MRVAVTVTATVTFTVAVRVTVAISAEVRKSELGQWLGSRLQYYGVLDEEPFGAPEISLLHTLQRSSEEMVQERRTQGTDALMGWNEAHE